MGSFGLNWREPSGAWNHCSLPTAAHAIAGEGSPKKTEIPPEQEGELIPRLHSRPKRRSAAAVQDAARQPDAAVVHDTFRSPYSIILPPSEKIAR
jgi:hypothetical protein